MANQRNPSSSREPLPPPSRTVPGREQLLAVCEELAEYPIPGPAAPELVLLEIDPIRLHAYWHLDPEALEQALRDAGTPYAPVAVRLLPVGEPGTRASFDVDIQSRQQSCRSCNPRVWSGL